MNEDRKFWVTTAIAVAALIISISSTLFNEIRHARSEKEALHVTLQKFYGEYPISATTEYSGLRGKGIVTTVWEVTLSNVGKSPASVVEYDLWTTHHDNLAQYSGFNQGLYDTNLAKIDLPINIAPGTSTKLYLKTGLSVGPKASKLIAAAPPEVRSRIMELSKHLAGKGAIDIFDNPVTAFWNKDNTAVTGFGVDSQENDQAILISFRTARNNSYGDESRWYEMPVR